MLATAGAEPAASADRARRCTEGEIAIAASRCANAVSCAGTMNPPNGSRRPDPASGVAQSTDRTRVMPTSSNHVFSSRAAGGSGSRSGASSAPQPPLEHPRVRVGRGVKSSAWDHFTRTVIKFDRAYFFASCKYCASDMSAADFLGFETTIGVDAAVTTEERKASRSAARDRGVVKGRADEMHRHLKLKCSKAPGWAQEAARVALSVSGGAKTNTSNIGQASLAPLSGAPGARAQAVRQISGEKRKRAPAMKNSNIGDYMAGGSRFEIKTEEVMKAVVDLLAVDKVPFNIVEGVRFRQFIKSLTGLDREAQGKKGLLLHQRKIRNKILPPAYDDAKKNLVRRASAALECCGLTYADDSWKSRASNHLCGVSLSSPSPSVAAMTIALASIPPESLNAVCIAAGWETVILLARRGAALKDYPPGWFVALPAVPVAFCSDDAAANRKARRILAIRHPAIVTVPCFGHQVALMCGDLVTKGSHAPVLAKNLKVITYFNSSYAKRLVWLRNEMQELYGVIWVLTLAVVTRWTSTWTSVISVLRVKLALKRLLLSSSWQQEIESFKNSNSAKAKSTREINDILDDASFWESMEGFVRSITPTIEVSLVLQDGNATLADVLYGMGRLCQVAQSDGEVNVIEAIEKRFEAYELPILFLALWVHPRYCSLAKLMIQKACGSLSVHRVVALVECYFRRWFAGKEDDCTWPEGTFQAVLGVCAWNDLKHPALLLADGMKSDPIRFWRMVLDTFQPVMSESDLNRSLVVLAKVALRVLSILPHAANVERLFSELGRLLSTARTRMKPPQSQKLVVIAEDYRVKHKAKMEAEGKPVGHKKRRISETCNVRDLLREMANGDVSCIITKASTAPSPAFAPLLPPLSSSAGPAVGGPPEDEPVITVDSDAGLDSDGQEILAEEFDISSPDVPGANDLDGDAGDAAAQDTEVTEMAMSDFAGFVSALERVIDSGGDSNEESGSDMDAPISTLSEMTATDDSLKRFPLGKLPDFNDKSVPHTNPTGDRAWKAKLSDLFDEAKIGKLASMTKIGAAQCS